MIALESWEITLLQLAYGSLLAGIVLFIFSLLTAEFNFDHDSDVSDFATETEIHIGGSFDVTTDVGIDINAETNFEIGHADIGHADIGHADTDLSNHNLEHHQSTPILLILSTFFLMFGAFGISIYQSEFAFPLIRIVLVIFLPIGFVKLVSFFWKKYTSKEHGVAIPFVTIDNQVKTLTHVDEKGGLVLAETGDYAKPETLKANEKMKMQAKTLPGVSIDRDSTAYVIAIDDKNTLIIDLWPKIAPKKGG